MSAADIRIPAADPAPFLIDVSENECLVPENYRVVLPVLPE